VLCGKRNDFSVNLHIGLFFVVYIYLGEHTTNNRSSHLVNDKSFSYWTKFMLLMFAFHNLPPFVV